MNFTDKSKRSGCVQAMLRLALFCAFTVTFFVVGWALGAEAQDAPQEDAQEKKGAYSVEAIKHYNRGVELQQTGYLTLAVKEYQAAIDADNRIEEAYTNLGLIYLAQKSFSKAQEAFTKALELKPNTLNSLNGLGSILYARGKTEEAMEKWKKTLEIDPNFASAHFNIGVAQELGKDNTAAIQSFFQAYEAGERQGKDTNAVSVMAESYYHIGSIYNKMNHHAQAQLLLKHAIQMLPDAEFVRDAKKQLAALENTFAKESAMGESNSDLKINVMSPPQGHTSHHHNPSPNKDSDKQHETPQVSQQKSDDSQGQSAQATEKKRVPLFKKPAFLRGRKSAAKAVDMFIQQPDPKDDLEAKPETPKP